MVKEFLHQNDIPAANISQRPQRAQRRCKKKVSTISVPMYPPVKQERRKLMERMKNGEIEIGEEVVPSSYHSYSVDPITHNLHMNTVSVTARKIPLIEIRQRLLKRHEDLGIMQNNSDAYFMNLCQSDVEQQLNELAIVHDGCEDKCQMLKDICRTRYLKIWHDHSCIAAHGYLLVLVSVIFDPAFYYTREEMKELKGVDIDVQAVLAQPEVHILGRSTSSIEDQKMFLDTRRECLRQMGERLCTKKGVQVHDIVCFFYGDGPAAQFEAGQKMGGHYPCVGCGANSNRFPDIAYCYQAPKPTLQE